MTRLAAPVAAMCAAVCAAVSLFGPAPVAADVIDFAAISATSTFGQGIDITEKTMMPGLVHRVEIVIQGEGDDASSVADVQPVRREGWTVLDYHLAVQPGQIIPNTLLHVRFRVTLTDGSVEVGPEATVRYDDTRFDWKVKSGQIVRVHWVEGSDAFATHALAIGDKAVADASALLGVTETEPVDFFIYPDPQSFRDVLGPATRENVGGVAFPGIRTLLTNITPEDINSSWVGIVIPHELTHLVFGTATDNPYHAPPHWLNEGLAVYLSQGFDSSDRGSVSDAAHDGSLMPLPALDGQFPTAADRFGLAYAEAVSALDFLVRTYGKPALVGLIRSYADGRTDDEAFKASLGVDVAGFEAAWVADLGVAEPSPVGPRPAPPGKLPPDWVAGAQPGGPGASGLPATTAGPVPSTGGGPDLGFLGIGGVVLLAVAAVLVLVYASRRARRGQPPPASPS